MFARAVRFCGEHHLHSCATQCRWPSIDILYLTSMTLGVTVTWNAGLVLGDAPTSEDAPPPRKLNDARI